MLNERKTLIYLNAIGISNNQINIIEDYILEKNLSYDVIFEKDFNEDIKKHISKGTYSKLINNNENILDDLYKRTCKNNINIVTYKEHGYPQRLKYIEDSPKVLYIRGEFDKKDDLSIGIVGSRKYTDYGLSVVKYFVDELSKLNVTIVSGMAYGIDSISHKRSLDNNNRTIAVLGSGVDVIYPIKNSNLYMNIINNGAVVSEYPLGTNSMPYHFPQRNRIISGLSLGIVVVEAKNKSGSLITAKCAAEQGREIFAVPGNINSIYSEGTNMLIRDGAIPLLSIDDILNNISIIKEQNKFDNKKDEIVDLTEDEKIIIDLIINGTQDINKICIESNFDISYTNSLLTILELKGLIESENNKDFNLT